MCQKENGENRPNRTGVMATNTVEVTLEPADIPVADLKEPFEMHAMPALRWWLLCRGIIFMEETATDRQVRPISTSMKVSVPSTLMYLQLYCVCRIRKANSDNLPVVDVDGSYLERKHKQMMDAGITVASLGAPTGTPLAGWEVMTEANVKDLAKKLPRVTSGGNLLK